ncbi:hypothetical protein F4561_004809 [Lipingzhangella halophila]|uniref:DUF4190 domain-containing protein n=1 Tax=Lipingzhangella halophila TaxID=1783352 RepID=A0A7W7W5L8_9ACTN|nr:DUF4190 domain-containing protein [Lipingzhangella halophila]MBB4933989.1 hypothetical protein [Lipingzhangella halophila]
MTKEPTEPRTEGQQPAVERGGLWGLLFAAAGLLLPPFGALLSIVGISQGRRARRAGRERDVPAPGAVMSMVLGWIGLGVSALMLAGYAVFWTEFSAYQECTTQAHTESSQTACDNTFREAVSERSGVPEDSIPILS